MSENKNPEDSGQATADAFRAVFAEARTASTLAPEPGPVAPQAAVEQAGTPAPTPTQAAAVAEPSDELAQLRADLAAAQATAEEYRRKGAESIDWARKGFFRKSDEAARATGLLKKAAETGELDADELAAFLASGGVAQPQPGFMAQPQPAADERMILDASQFVFDYGLSEKAATDYLNWLNGDGRTHLTERDLEGSHYAQLRHGYEKYRAATAVPDPALTAAAQTVARTQREIARGAAAAPSRVMPTPEPTPPDYSKMSVKEREDSGLIDQAFRELAQQYK